LGDLLSGVPLNIHRLCESPQLSDVSLHVEFFCFVSPALAGTL
jgi:hypothetical protein